MTGLNSGLRAGQEKLFDSLMPEAAYHPAKIVLRNVTLHNRLAVGPLESFPPTG
jgi:hypothetical protein